MNDALDAWEPYAVALLTDTAKKDNAFVTYKQLGDTVQGQSGIRHDGLLTNWIGSLLGRRYCQYLWMGCCPFSADLRRRRVFVIGSDARCSLRAVAGPALVAAA